MFREQYRRYYRALVLYVIKMVPADSSAEDIVQDVFMNLWRKRYLIEKETELRSFLYTSVRNRALDYLKHRHVEQSFIDKAKDKAPAYILNANDEEDFFSDEIFRRLFRHVDSLPPRQCEFRNSQDTKSTWTGHFAQTNEPGCSSLADGNRWLISISYVKGD